MGETYRCLPKEFKYIIDNGKFTKNKFDKGFTDYFIWNGDEKSLTRYYKDGNSNKVQPYIIIQEGNSDNSFVAIHAFKGAASVYSSYIAIETFNKSLPFLFTSNTWTISGNCF